MILPLLFTKKMSPAAPVAPRVYVERAAQNDGIGKILAIACTAKRTSALCRQCFAEKDRIRGASGTGDRLFVYVNWIATVTYKIVPRSKRWCYSPCPC